MAFLDLTFALASTESTCCASSSISQVLGMQEGQMSSLHIFKTYPDFALREACDSMCFWCDYLRKFSFRLYRSKKLAVLPSLVQQLCRDLSFFKLLVFCCVVPLIIHKNATTYYGADVYLWISETWLCKKLATIPYEGMGEVKTLTWVYFWAWCLN